MTFRHPDTFKMDSQVVRRGTVRVKKEGFASFIFFRKWLVLKEDTLAIHKTECAPPQSVIPLQDVTHLERVESKVHCLLLGARDKRYHLVLGSDEELYGWQDDIYARSPLAQGVSSPWNFVHNVHIGFDPISGMHTGMPEQWRKLLTNSAMDYEDYTKVSQAVLDQGTMGLVPPSIRTPPPPFDAGAGLEETTVGRPTVCTTTTVTDAHHPNSLTLQISASGLQSVSVATKERIHKVDITLTSPEPARNRSIAIQTTSNDAESERGLDAVIVPLVLYE